MIIRELVLWLIGTALTVSFVGVLTKIVSPTTWTPILIIIIILWLITLIARIFYLAKEYTNKYFK